MAASGNAGRTQEGEVHHSRSKGITRRRASLTVRLGAPTVGAKLTEGDWLHFRMVTDTTVSLG